MLLLLVMLLSLALVASACGTPADDAVGADDPPPVAGVDDDDPPAEDDEPADEEPPAAEPTQVTIAQFTAPGQVFHPQLTTSAYDSDIAGQLFDSLLTLDEELAWVPNMADFEISDDQLSITYTLKDGLEWSDGTPITSRDIYVTYATQMHPEWPGPGQSNVAQLRGGFDLLDAYGELLSRVEPEDPDDREAGVDYITHDEYIEQAVPLYEEWLTTNPVETPDDKTAIIHFDTVYAPALQTFGGSLIPAHVYEGIPVADWARADVTKRPPASSGPYTFVTYVTDQYTELEANDKFWRGRPNIDKVIFKIVDAQVAIGELEIGQVDAVGVGSSQISPQDYEEIVRHYDNIYAWENPQYGYQHLFFNLLHPFLGIKEVRQAMTYAVDRQALVEELLLGYGTVMNSVFLPIQWAYDEASLNPYPYDPDKARELLAEAGFTEGSDGVLEKDGMKFEVNLAVPTASNPVREASAPLIQQYLGDVGIKVNVDPLEFDTMIDNVVNIPGQEPFFDMGLLGWSLTIDPDQTGLWGENDIYNFTKFTTATVGDDYDRFLQLNSDGLKTFIQEERAAMYQEVGKIFNDQLPYMFLYTQNDITVFNTRVQNVNQDIRGATFNIEDWVIAD